MATSSDGKNVNVEDNRNTAYIDAEQLEIWHCSNYKVAHFVEITVKY